MGWTADQWIEWLRRGPSDPAPNWRGLNDAADAIAAELAKLRKERDAK